MSRITVIAIGGNSLLDLTKPPTVANQFAVTERAMVHVADLIERQKPGERSTCSSRAAPAISTCSITSPICIRCTESRCHLR